MKNDIKNMIQFLIIFYRFWTRFESQVGTMLELCWAQSLQKNDFANNTKKTLKKEGPETL